MTTGQPTTHLRISMLWIAVLFAMLFRDLHQLGKPGYLDEISAMEVSDGLFLVAGIVITLPIVMIPLNLWLAGLARRWTNTSIAALTLLGAISIIPSDLDDWWFFAVEAVLLAVIVRLAWPQEDLRETTAGHTSN